MVFSYGISALFFIAVSVCLAMCAIFLPLTFRLLPQFAARASSQAALEAAKEGYVEAMECLVGGDRPFLKTVQMEAEHEKERKKAVNSYLEKNKYGRKNQRVVEKYEEQLNEVGSSEKKSFECLGRFSFCYFSWHHVKMKFFVR